MCLAVVYRNFSAKRAWVLERPVIRVSLRVRPGLTSGGGVARHGGGGGGGVCLVKD